MSRSGPPLAGLVLVGLRATGKTSIGRLLAQRAGLGFADTDAEVQRAAGGQAISEIFRLWGEPRFRQLESEALASLAQTHKGGVLATGGGIVLREENRRLLKDHGFVVWLHADPAVLAERLRSDAAGLLNRPALTPAGTLEEIAALWQAREPLYRALADATLDTTALSVDQAAAAALALWRRAAGERL